MKTTDVRDGINDFCLPVPCHPARTGGVRRVPGLLHAAVCDARCLRQDPAGGEEESCLHQGRRQEGESVKIIFRKHF